MQIRYGLAGMAMLCATGAAAQNFTTAAEVRPILEATKPNWIAVRNYEGQDWLYFTQILSWRCGLSDVWFSVNGAPEERLDMEACHEDTNAPNTMRSERLEQFLRTYPPGSVDSVAIRLVLDDGTETRAAYDRKAVEIP
ncbi:hypothetical protein [Lacimonas salitolerans]|uniref:Uncharacterized protein n=1 Tax=Lacimonas salitolerans TaxID=1323750 RepID=A0ABW4EBU2_9RHOB